MTGAPPRAGLWPKDLTVWEADRVGFISVPFTWLLPRAQAWIDGAWPNIDRWVAGGPAVDLMPEYLKGAAVGGEMPGALQRVNPFATRTSIGCPRRCEFCAIGRRRIEPEFRELPDWPAGRVVMDNNLLATSRGHFGRVIDRLKAEPWCDLQGVDPHFVTAWHAGRLAELRRPRIRLGLDDQGDVNVWARAVELLHRAGIPKRSIRTYVLIGYGDNPREAWRLCEAVEALGYTASPLWYHPLDAMRRNAITDAQRLAGWEAPDRDGIMGWYYKHRGKGPPAQALGALVR